MKKRIISVILSVLVVTSIISGCGNTETQGNTQATSQEDEISVSDENTTDATNTPISEIPEVDINMDFNSSLIDFIEKYGFSDKNYMISPTSFRAALALAVAGADNETKDELLKAMGFNSMDELISWYEGVTASVDSYNEWLKTAQDEFNEYRDYYEDDAQAPDGAFDLENSIWRNTKSSGELSKKYIEYVKETFGATAENVSEKKITDTVNSWINDNTNGLIPSISNDLSYADLILVNTLYLRTSWVNDFFEPATQEGDFKTLSGETVKKLFSRKVSVYKYFYLYNKELY